MCNRNSCSYFILTWVLKSITFHSIRTAFARPRGQVLPHFQHDANASHKVHPHKSKPRRVSFSLSWGVFSVREPILQLSREMQQNRLEYRTSEGTFHREQRWSQPRAFPKQFTTVPHGPSMFAAFESNQLHKFGMRSWAQRSGLWILCSSLSLSRYARCNSTALIRIVIPLDDFNGNCTRLRQRVESCCMLFRSVVRVICCCSGEDRNGCFGRV